MKNIKGSSVVVQWDAVDDSLPTTYTVIWHSGRDSNTTQTKQTSYTITGLPLDTVYTINVSAANRCGRGPEFVTTTGMYVLFTLFLTLILHTIMFDYCNY